MGHALASIAWNPEIRNILSLLVGVGVLMGSVYLLLATNVGARLGLMITLAALFGWMATMGAIWWIYGIGMRGSDPHWVVEEINIGDLTQAGIVQATTLPEPDQLPDPADILEDHPELVEQVIPEGQEGKVPTLGELVEVDPALIAEYHLEPDDLGGWKLLEQSDPARGDAVASSDAVLGPDGKKIFTDTSEYKVLDVFERGGKPDLADAECKPRFVHPVWDGCWERVKHKVLSVWHWSHPTHYAVVQVQEVIHPCTDTQNAATDNCVEVPAGEAPPPAQVDPDAPVRSVIMVRNLGDLRFPAAMVTIVFTFLFGLTCQRLHAREKLLMANRAAAPAG